jgi:hypothetical protein
MGSSSWTAAFKLYACVCVCGGGGPDFEVLPYWAFFTFSNFKLSDFNEETTSSLKMI